MNRSITLWNGSKRRDISTMSENELTNEQNRQIAVAVEEAKRKLTELNAREDAEREKMVKDLGYSPAVLDNGHPSPERAAIRAELKKEIDKIKNEPPLKTH